MRGSWRTIREKSACERSIERAREHTERVKNVALWVHLEHLEQHMDGTDGVMDFFRKRRGHPWSARQVTCMVTILWLVWFVPLWECSSLSMALVVFCSVHSLCCRDCYHYTVGWKDGRMDGWDGLGIIFMWWDSFTISAYTTFA